MITIVPLGTRPHSLNLYKFRRACQNAFWLEYDPDHIKHVKSNKMIILSCYGLVFFNAGTGTYSEGEVLAYAEKNGWKRRGSAFIRGEQLVKHASGICDASEEEGCIVEHYLGTESSYCWQTKDCIVLVFETGNVHGLPSYVSIAADGSQVEIRCIDHRLPDPNMKFVLPDGFEPFKAE